MPASNDQSLPPDQSGLQGGTVSRSVLGLLLLLLVLAVIIAIWAMAFGDDEATTLADRSPASGAPTPLPIPTSTAIPIVDGSQPATATPSPTSTPVPAGFEACTPDRAPLPSATYVVDTVSVPLNQRQTPAVQSTLMGSFAPGETGLVFTGECVVNLADGYVWWKIFNGTTDVWVASSFVSRN